MTVRRVLLVVALGVLGYCIGALTRSTAATIAVLPAVFVLAAIRHVAGLGKQFGSWSPGINAEAILYNGTSYSAGGLLDEDSLELKLSMAHGLGYWAVLCTVAVIVSWLVFVGAT